MDNLAKKGGAVDHSAQFWIGALGHSTENLVLCYRPQHRKFGYVLVAGALNLLMHRDPHMLKQTK
jgi:hypothetical protein